MDKKNTIKTTGIPSMKEPIYMQITQMIGKVGQSQIFKEKLTIPINFY